jgi:arginyl-tRNA--protein-N-Asp/Glu arginylyltransferase
VPITRVISCQVAHINDEARRIAANVAELRNAFLKANAEYRQYSLYDRSKANQRHKNFEQISKPSVAHKSINQIKANCTDDHDNQYVYQREKHRADSKPLNGAILRDSLLVMKTF